MGDVGLLEGVVEGIVRAVVGELRGQGVLGGGVVVDDDEVRAMQVFGGKAVVGIDGLRFYLGWGRDKVEGLMKAGVLVPVGGGGRGCAWEFAALEVWQYIHGKGRFAHEAEAGVDMNVLPLSRRGRRMMKDERLN